MARRTFTPHEVQGLIPTLELLFGRLTLVMREAKTTQRALETVAVSDAELLNQRLKGLLDEARDLVGKVQATGAQVKDLEQGLVDFPSWREGRVVLLCWQFGERQLAYWHGEDEGFAGRKPLEGGTPQPVNVLN